MCKQRRDETRREEKRREEKRREEKRREEMRSMVCYGIQSVTLYIIDKAGVEKWVISGNT